MKTLKETEDFIIRKDGPVYQGNLKINNTEINEFKELTNFAGYVVIFTNPITQKLQAEFVSYAIMLDKVNKLRAELKSAAEKGW